LIERGVIDESLPYLNTDNIQKDLGGYTLENSLTAEVIIKNHMKDLIAEAWSFMIESNLAKASDYEWVGLMRKQGYQTVLYFLGTDDVEINKRRVLQRVMEGGHGVPEPIIEQRYRMGLTYLKKEILSLDEAHLVDGSGYPPREVATLQQGRIISKEPGLPKWVNEVLFLAERLQEKRKQP
jgi:predicted ABC-type ATPase